MRSSYLGAAKYISILFIKHFINLMARIRFTKIKG